MVRKHALITGGNKGIGFETARQLAEAGWQVVIGARDGRRGQQASELLAEQGLDVRAVPLDVRDGATIAEAVSTIDHDLCALDLLVNNAGIASRQDGPPSSASLAVVRDLLETNFIGALAVTQAVLPLLRRSEAARIVNVSSALGSLAVNGDRTSPYFSARSIGYNASKAALNMLTVQLDAELGDDGVTAVSVSPGFVKTDLLGGIGVITAAEGAAVVVRAALAPGSGATGRHVSADGEIPW